MIYAGKLTAEDKIIRAKVSLNKDHPFFSYLIVKMKISEDKDGILKAMGGGMGVNARAELIWDRDFVDSLSCEQVEYVLCHEVMHIVLDHIKRTGHKNKWLVNYTQDMKINDIVNATGKSPPPNGVIPRNDHTCVVRYKDKNGQPAEYIVQDIDKKIFEEIYEEIYPLLYKEPEGDQPGGEPGGDGEADGQGGGQDGWDIHIRDGKGSGKPLTEKEKENLRQSWKQSLSEAATYAKQIGKLPAGIARLVDGLLDSKVPWQQLIAQMATSLIISDFTYSRPHKKSQSVGEYLPNVVRENIEMITHMDTSGSIGEEEMKTFLTEMNTLMTSFANVTMTVIVCDAEIQDIFEFGKNDIDEMLATAYKGGGGTSHRPVVEWINENKPDAKLLITLTDGYSDIESEFPKLPETMRKIIALSKEGVQSEQLEAYGEVVRIE